jgi:hypothetical protein
LRANEEVDVVCRSTAILTIALAAVCVVAMLPPVADHFGYARPVPGGLPHRFVAGDLAFTRMSGCVHISIPEQTWTCRKAGSARNLSASCSSFSAIAAARPAWHLGEFGTVPTLLAHPYTVWIWETPDPGPGPPYGLAFVEDGACFVIYHRSS